MSADFTSQLIVAIYYINFVLFVEQKNDNFVRITLTYGHFIAKYFKSHLMRFCITNTFNVAFCMWSLTVTFCLFADENRDINGHPEDDLKRQRSHYNGDQLYSNVSFLNIENLQSHMSTSSLFWIVRKLNV